MSTNTRTTSTTAPDIFDKLADKWPSTLVAAPLVKSCSGGAVSGKTLANLSAAGEVVPESVKVGNRRCYVVTSLADWLRNRSKGGNQ